jgi:hypothetical protein
VNANARLLKWPVFTCPSLVRFARPLTGRALNPEVGPGRRKLIRAGLIRASSM